MLAYPDSPQSLILEDQELGKLLMRQYLVEHLGLSELRAVAWCQTFASERATLTTLRPVSGDWIRRVLAVFGIKEIYHCDREIGDFRDEDGANLFWAKDRFMHAVASETLRDFDVARFAESLGGKYPADHLRLFLERSVNREFYSELGFYCMLRRLADERETDNVVALIRASPFSAAIVKTVFKNARCRTLVYRAAPDLSASLRRVAGLIRDFLRSYRSQPAGAGSEVRPLSTIALACDANLARDLPRGIGPPWVSSSGIPRERILVYVDGAKADKDFPIIKSQIEAFGMRWLDMRSWQPSRSRVSYHVELRHWIKTLLRAALSRRLAPLRLRLWAVSWLSLFGRGIARYGAFFDEFGIGIHLHSGDSEELLVAKILALESRGGFDLSWQFSGSGEDLPMNYRPMKQHLYFCWGRCHAEFIRRSDLLTDGKAPNVLFLGGNVLGYHNSQPASEAIQAVKDLRASGAQLILGVFDAVPAAVFSRRQVETFYETMSKLVAKHDNIGLLIKPHGDTVGRYGFADTVNRLGTYDRVRVLPSTVRIFNLLSVIDAAVILGVQNSAGNEAAMGEVPHILFDLAAVRSHPFYRWLPAGVIAETVEEFEVLVNAHLGRTALKKGDPEWDGYLDWLEPYRDGKAHERFGRFMSLLLEGLYRHGAAEKAIPEIVRKYQAMEGADKVLCSRWPYDPANPQPEIVLSADDPSAGPTPRSGTVEIGRDPSVITRRRQAASPSTLKKAV